MGKPDNEPEQVPKHAAPGQPTASQVERRTIKTFAIRVGTHSVWLPGVLKPRGRVLAQDEASSVVFGMAQAAIEARLADEVVPLDGIAQRLRELVHATP